MVSCKPIPFVHTDVDCSVRDVNFFTFNSFKSLILNNSVAKNINVIEGYAIGWSDFQFFGILKIATFRWILVGILRLK